MERDPGRQTFLGRAVRSGLAIEKSMIEIAKTAVNNVSSFSERKAQSEVYFTAFRGAPKKQKAPLKYSVSIKRLIATIFPKKDRTSVIDEYGISLEQRGRREDNPFLKNL